MSTAPAPADAPAWWLQYRKALVAFGVGALAVLTDLLASHTDPHLTAQERTLHALIVLVSALLSTAGVAAIPNVYSVPALLQKLIAARRGAPVDLTGTSAEDHAPGAPGEQGGRW